MTAHHWVLIGARASGKSTIGRLLAARSDRPFVDLDDLVIASFPETTVESIWREHGEIGWRAAEGDALERALDRRERTVLALGGGTPMIDTARDRILAERAAGRVVVIFLDGDPEVLASRVREGRDRPSLTGRDPADEMAEVLAARRPTYESIADLTYDTTSTDEATTVAHLIGDLVSGNAAAD